MFTEGLLITGASLIVDSDFTAEGLVEEGLGVLADDGAPLVGILVRVGEPARPGIGSVVASACLVAIFEFGPAAGAGTAG